MSLTLVNGGLTGRLRFEDPTIQLRATGQAGGTPFDVTGPVTIDFVEMDITFDVGVQAGQPRVIIRPGSVAVRVGSIGTSFPGLDGSVVDLIVTLANGAIRDVVASTLGNFMASNASAALDGLVSSLDFPSGSVTVPRIGQPGVIALDVLGRLSSLSANPVRALFALGTRITAVTEHAIPSLGVVLPDGPVFQDPPSGGRPVTVSTHIGAINQALHALWRAGLLHTTLDASVLGGVPAGTVVTVETLLPPVVGSFGLADELDLGIGAVRLALTYPGVFDEPVSVEIGAEASVVLGVGGDALAVTGVTIDGVHLSDPETAVGGAGLAVLHAVAPAVLQRLVEAAIGGATRAVRSPAFRIPASLGPFGLPVGSEVGLVSPMLAAVDPRVDLRGNLGIR